VRVCVRGVRVCVRGVRVCVLVVDDGSLL